jgi:hypothetical protein
MTTTTIEIDSDLLAWLRERRPEQSDRELIEGTARIQLGLDASARARERFAGVVMSDRLLSTNESDVR